MKFAETKKQVFTCYLFTFFCFIIAYDNFLTILFNIFAEIFRQRKRSKSKVKTQERRGSSSEDYGHHQGAGLIGDTTKQQQRQSD